MVLRCASVWRGSSFQVQVNQLLMSQPSCRAFNLPLLGKCSLLPFSISLAAQWGLGKPSFQS